MNLEEKVMMCFRPENRAKSEALRLSELLKISPLGESHLQFAFKKLAESKSADETKEITIRREDCAQFAGILIPGNGEVDECVETWEAWRDYAKYKSKDDESYSGLVTTLQRELEELAV